MNPIFTMANFLQDDLGWVKLTSAKTVSNHQILKCRAHPFRGSSMQKSHIQHHSQAFLVAVGSEMMQEYWKGCRQFFLLYGVVTRGELPEACLSVVFSLLTICYLPRPEKKPSKIREHEGTSREMLRNPVPQKCLCASMYVLVMKRSKYVEIDEV